MTLLSAGIEIKEKSLITNISRAATGRGATVGKFQWGEPFAVNQLADEDDLIKYLGLPDDYTYSSWYSVSNFLKYATDCRVARIVNTTYARNSSPIFNAITKTILNPGSGYSVNDVITVKQGPTTIATGKVTAVGGSPAGQITAFSIDVSGIIERLDAGTLTNAELDQTASPQTVTYSIVKAGVSPNVTTTGAVKISLNRTNGVYFQNPSKASDALNGSPYELGRIQYAAESIPSVYGKYAGYYGDDISVVFVTYADYVANIAAGTLTVPVRPDNGSTSYTRTVKLAAFGTNGPQTADQIGVIVYYKDEQKEVYTVSYKADDKDVFNNNIYIDDFFANDGSEYIALTSDIPVTVSMEVTLAGGEDTGAVTGNWQSGWDLFDDPETIYVNLMFTGGASSESAATATDICKYVADNIAAVRKDGLLFISPPQSLVVGKAAATAVADVVEWRKGVDISNQTVTPNCAISTSFCVFDGSFKYQHDRYTGKKRWIPLSGDIAGLCAFTDSVGNVWDSPAGYNRGIIKNVTKLAYDPKRSLRDTLYEAQINPVINSSGSGFVLLGDKTAQTKPDPFDRINVRRTFNFLEKGIGDSTKYKLFENNTEFVRNQFVQEVSAYLSTIKARGGVEDFYVQCDEKNNPAVVRQRNEFVASIFIKPVYSINYITLNFVATGADASFEELVGAPL